MATVRTFLSKLFGTAPREIRSQAPSRARSPAVRNGRDMLQEFDDDSNFRFPASDNLLSDIGSEQLLRVIKAFAPSQPTQHISQFAGRTRILSQVITAIEEHRNHLVLFGGRGTGKTSLALAMSSAARRAGYHCAYVSCSRESTVDSIFRSALTELPIRFDQQFDPRDESVDPTLSFEALIPEGNNSPQSLADVLSRIRGTRLLVVVDEYDRNENPTLTRDMTEIMKVVSDRAIPVQVVIVGVGDVVDNLVGEHASIARVLYVVRLTSMTDEQIRETLAVASKAAGVDFRPEVVEAIVGIAHGRPYTARLVGLKASKMAILRGSTSVEIEDFDTGTDELLHYLDSVGFGHAARLIGDSPHNTALFTAMLNCRRDSSDRFTIADVCSELERQTGARNMADAVQRTLDLVASPELGLLTATRGAVTLYQFIDPRAELCIAILCGRAQKTQAAAQKPSAEPVLRVLTATPDPGRAGIGGS